jgi:tetratricopeptide (TPR) repeat protein
MADVCRDLWQLRPAKTFCERSLKIRQALSTADPNNALLRRDLSICFDKLGYLCEFLGQWEAARQWYQRRLDIAEALAAGSQQLLNLTDVIYTQGELASVAMSAADFAVAKSLYGKIVEATQRLAKAGKLDHTEFESWPKFYQGAFDNCTLTEKLTNDPSKLGDQPPDRQWSVLVLVVRQCVQRKMTKEAVAAAGRLATVQPENGQVLFDAGCAYGAVLKSLPAKDNQREDVVQRAVAVLKLAMSKGFHHRDLFLDQLSISVHAERGRPRGRRLSPRDRPGFLRGWQMARRRRP